MYMYIYIYQSLPAVALIPCSVLQESAAGSLLPVLAYAGILFFLKLRCGYTGFLPGIRRWICV